MSDELADWAKNQEREKLRDTFAAVAMAVLVKDLTMTVAETCEACYDYADAMLAEREKR